jgi:hypothetical protein
VSSDALVPAPSAGVAAPAATAVAGRSFATAADLWRLVPVADRELLQAFGARVGTPLTELPVAVQADPARQGWLTLSGWPVCATVAVHQDNLARAVAMARDDEAAVRTLPRPSPADVALLGAHATVAGLITDGQPTAPDDARRAGYLPVLRPGNRRRPAWIDLRTLPAAVERARTAAAEAQRSQERQAAAAARTARQRATSAQAVVGYALTQGGHQLLDADRVIIERWIAHLPVRTITFDTPVGRMADRDLVAGSLELERAVVQRAIVSGQAHPRAAAIPAAVALPRIAPVLAAVNPPPVIEPTAPLIRVVDDYAAWLGRFSNLPPQNWSMVGQVAAGDLVGSEVPAVYQGLCSPIQQRLVALIAAGSLDEQVACAVPALADLVDTLRTIDLETRERLGRLPSREAVARVADQLSAWPHAVTLGDIVELLVVAERDIARIDPDDRPIVLNYADLGVTHDPANRIIYAAADPTPAQRRSALVDAALNNPEWEFIGQMAHRRTPAELRRDVLQLAAYLGEPVTERILRGVCEDLVEEAERFGRI